MSVAKLIIWSMRHPKSVLAGLIVFSLLTASQIPKIRIDASAEGMMMKGDPSFQDYQETIRKFGTDTITVILIRDDRLFSPDKLKFLDDLRFECEERLPGVEKVESLFSVTNFKGEGGTLSTNPLIDSIPETQEEALKIRTDALGNPLLLNGIVSKDGTATAINIYVLPDPKDADFHLNFSRKVDEIIAQHKTHFGEIFQLGNSYTKRTISDHIMKDQYKIVPFSVLVLIIILLFSLRSLSGAIMPLATAGLSVLWTVGFMAFMEIPINVLTCIIPSLLIVIASTDDLHMLIDFKEGMKKHGNDRAKAIEYMAENMGTAIFLTAFTTILGYLSIILNPIVILKEFGIVASFGFTVNPIASYLFAPIYLRYFGPKPRKETGGTKPLTQMNATERFFSAISRNILFLLRNYKWYTFGILISVALIIGSFIPRIRVNNDLMGFFKPDSEIRQRSRILHDQIAGAQPFYIHVSAGYPDAFKQPENLRQIENIQKFMQEKGYFDKITSIVDYLSLIHREMNNGDPSFYKVPETSGLVAQYLLTLRRDEISRFATSDLSEINVLVRHNIGSSFELKNAVKAVEDYIKKTLNPHFKYGFTGENILVNQAADSMAWGQVTSLGSLLLTVFILLAIVYVNLKAGAISLVPNVYPIMVILGIMGIFRIPLNTGTAMVAAISFGIAVDDTIHLMIRYKNEMRERQNAIQAVEATVSHEIVPTVSSSIALAGGFAVVCFSSFVPVVDFGYLSAITMLVGVLGDLYLSPTLLSSTQLITIWDMMELKLKDDVIKRSPFFSGLRPWQIKKVVLMSRVYSRQADQAAIRQGEMGSSMYILLEGSANVLVSDEATDHQVRVAQLSPGDVFGEISLIEPGPRSADVIAVEDIKYLEIDWNGLNRMRTIFPRIAGRLFLNLSRILGQRLICTDKMLMEASR